MDLKEAVRSGRDFKRPHWDGFAYLSPMGAIRWRHALHLGVELRETDIFADDYVLYQEPPVLVPHWPAIFLTSVGHVLSSVLFSSVDEYRDSSLRLGEIIRLATEYPPIMLERKK